MNIAILVVLYNKEIFDSHTLKSLSCLSVPNGDLIILNNGPQDINRSNDVLSALNKGYKSVSIITHLDNLPLSKAYNNFINFFPNSDYYIILDDDSEITLDYFNALSHLSADLMLPKIISRDDGVFYYPMYDNKIITTDQSVRIDKLMSISSGLIISGALKSKLHEKFGNVFDNRFALYGVDTSFFLRLRKMDWEIKAIIQSYVNHSLSRTQSDISEFRRIERLYDLAITARHYPEYVSFYSVLKIFIKSLLQFDIKGSFALIRGYVIGRHPRSII